MLLLFYNFKKLTSLLFPFNFHLEFLFCLAFQSNPLLALIRIMQSVSVRFGMLLLKHVLKEDKNLVEPFESVDVGFLFLKVANSNQITLFIQKSKKRQLCWSENSKTLIISIDLKRITRCNLGIIRVGHFWKYYGSEASKS